ncbi:TPA: type I-F CRISPR-associated protein Csy2 [Pasteurella multocida]|uniref:type I-F CRISPR-associated protein Csy2 n=1 Tax=Pasteurella multocida TaxID=747 RepID=UPI0003439625|nr:type I-F CRISPR-associated protein Csy2 [Pasteurella multocida]AWW59278.1 type I-F CRISPR-associated protein Csy2 [Pasteurellaceae bacterium 12591]AHE63724.1 CRIR-associated protein, Csy2 family [Pasteurella multocida subsp. multocida str. HB03]AIN49231.1 CRISPR-associated family protein [Pasteurella multocida]ANJ89554.1 CRISPR-associated protein, Csy2 family [Pasteurella multocida subsp. multocida HB01]AON58224.1 type I-F CRISPR-associated protein Csy2 [Pasteurella multocida]
MFQTDFYILFDHIKVQSANAISGPLSYGFPALTGLTGAMHALNRKLTHHPVQFGGVMVACHDYELQTYQNSAFSDRTFKQTRNPIKRNGETASIIEEGKIHLDLSLVVEVHVQDDRVFEALTDKTSQASQDFLQTCKNLLWQQRIAGGSVLEIGNVQLFNLEEDQDIPLALMPAFVLMDAKQELTNITEELKTGLRIGQLDEEGNVQKSCLPSCPDATALDALLEMATVHHIPEHANATASAWQTYSVKKGRGWLVPLPVGYQAISPLFAPGQLQHCRTQQYPSQYVETLYSLGKWVFPLSLPENLSQCFWRYTALQNNLYLISQGE